MDLTSMGPCSKAQAKGVYMPASGQSQAVDDK